MLCLCGVGDILFTGSQDSSLLTSNISLPWLVSCCRCHDLGPQQLAVHWHLARASGLCEMPSCLVCQEGLMLRQGHQQSAPAVCTSSHQSLHNFQLVFSCFFSCKTGFFRCSFRFSRLSGSHDSCVEFGHLLHGEDFDGPRGGCECGSLAGTKTVGTCWNSTRNQHLS